MLKFIPDHLKTKQICNYAVKKLRFVIRYVPDQNKSKKMRNKGVIKNDETVESIPYRYKTQEIDNKAIDNYAHVFVPDWYKTQRNVYLSCW